MSKYDIILFDADETLFDFNKSAQIALEHTLKKYGFEYSEQIRQDYMKINHEMWDLFEQGKIEKSDLLIKRFELLFEQLGKKADAILFNDEYLTKLSYGNYLLCGAKEIVEKLYGTFKLYIITNGTRKAQVNRISTSEIARYFEKVYISEDIGFQKPRCEFFDFVLSDIGVTDKSRLLIVGDSLTSDIQGGINSKIDTCWFSVDNSVETELKYTYRIDTLSDLVDILS